MSESVCLSFSPLHSSAQISQHVKVCFAPYDAVMFCEAISLLPNIGFTPNECVRESPPVEDENGTSSQPYLGNNARQEVSYYYSYIGSRLSFRLVAHGPCLSTFEM